MSTIESRLHALERRLRRTQALAGSAAFALVVILSLGWKRQADDVDHIRVRRLDLVDDAGVVRLRLGQDDRETFRRSRATGLIVLDKTGRERGGFSTFDDGSVILAMDAPHGVGDPMPDRLALGVDRGGSSSVMLLDNQTRAVAKLHSDGNGGGGVQVFRWDMEKKEVHVKTLTFAGEETETVPMER